MKPIDERYWKTTSKNSSIYKEKKTLRQLSFSKNSNSDCVRNYHTKNSVIDLYLFIFEFEFWTDR